MRMQTAGDVKRHSCIRHEMPERVTTCRNFCKLRRADLVLSQNLHANLRVTLKKLEVP